MILRKIIKTIATRWISRIKCTKFDFGWGSAPDPATELTALPRHLAGFKGGLLLRKEKDRQMNGRDSRGEKGEGEDDLFSVIFSGRGL